MTKIQVSKDGIKHIDVLVDDYEVTKYTETIELEFEYLGIHYTVTIPREKGFNISISDIEVLK